jgi:hypothetical protein
VTGRSFARRYWASLTDAADATPTTAGERERRGYGFGQRYRAALLGVRLPPKDDTDDVSPPELEDHTAELDDASAAAVLLHARERAGAVRRAVAREPGRGTRFRNLGLTTDEELRELVRDELGLSRDLDRVLGLTLNHELSGDLAPSAPLDLARILARALTLDLDLTLDRENDRALGRELDQAIDLAQRLGHRLDAAAALAAARATARESAREFAPRGLATRSTAMRRTREYARAIDATRVIARHLARELIDTIDAQLMAMAVDARGVDLSAIGPSELEILAGVVWDERTTWATEVADEVRARSREIRSGVWQVVGGTERDFADLTTA